MKNNKEFDVIIVGGSYAGLSAAMTLGRSLRQVLVLDTGKPCNTPTPHSHNFLTQDGATPQAIITLAREQVLAYDTVQLLNAKAVDTKKIDNYLEVIMDSGETFTAKKVIFATGIIDLLPDIDGFAACWGISILHCPYCHGYEVRHKKTGLLGNGDLGFELAKLISNWTKEVCLYTNGASTLTEQQTALLKAKNIPVIETAITKMEHEQGYLKSLHLKDGSRHELEAIYARIGFKQHSDIPEKLGCAFTDTGHIQVNDFGKTSLPDVYAVGDCTTPMRSVAVVVAAGNKAGAWINKELIEENF